VTRSCILVRWRLSRACTLKASVQSKRSCIAPWTTHGLRSENCACASGSRKRPRLSSILTSRTFGGCGHQRRCGTLAAWPALISGLHLAGSDLRDEQELDCAFYGHLFRKPGVSPPPILTFQKMFRSFENSDGKWPGCPPARSVWSASPRPGGRGSRPFSQTRSNAYRQSDIPKGT
jgi:hypothetical protein